MCQIGPFYNTTAMQILHGINDFNNLAEKQCKHKVNILGVNKAKFRPQQAEKRPAQSLDLSLSLDLHRLSQDHFTMRIGNIDIVCLKRIPQGQHHHAANIGQTILRV